MMPFPQGIPIASSGLIPLSSWHSSLPSPKGVFLCLLDGGQDIQSLCFLLVEASVGVGRLMVCSGQEMGGTMVLLRQPPHQR